MIIIIQLPNFHKHELSLKFYDEFILDVSYNHKITKWLLWG